MKREYAMVRVPGACDVPGAATWALTHGARPERAPQGTPVTGLHVGFADTDLMRGLEVGDAEIFADDLRRLVKLGLRPAAAAP